MQQQLLYENNVGLINAAGETRRGLWIGCGRVFFGFIML